VEEAGTLVVERLEATSRAAYRSLWELLLDFDLTRRIVVAGRPTDEPLRWMLRNPRAMRITRLSDNLWLRLLDVPAALRARVYNEETTLALRIASDAMCPHNVGTWQLTTNVRGATCEPTDAHPSLVIDIRALGMLYLGGGSASLLAAAGLIDELQPGALATLSRLLRSDPAPFNALGF
jgi:predicted acetyltransferase